MQRGSNSSIVVRVVIAALVVGAGYLVYEFGRIQAGYNLLDAAEERAGLSETIVELENEIQSLNEQIALLETHRDIEQAAYADVEDSLTELQTRIQEQQDAIAFYRGIVSPADGNSGLRVQDFRLTRGAEEREYTIRLVLIQAMKHNRRVSGEVELIVEGTENGEQKSYSYADLVPEDADETWAFSFRYFQDFDRQVVLPDGFTPERVNVQVESRTRSIDSIEEDFSWLTSVS
ncbi:MAG: hypothetical protein QNI99_08395 [Woeseiaceae bacterium]|nr:hypothetical protein [Woeseiaceae bacterium]